MLHSPNRQNAENGVVVWITGLSGAGKSTIAGLLAGKLRDTGHPCVVLDGDELRAALDVPDASANEHRRTSRIRFGLRYGRLARLIARQGLIVIVSTISLAREVHTWNREHLESYFEVYVRVPLEELRRRDPKNIYQRYDLGQLKNVWGLDIPFDEPASPDLLLEFQEGRSAQANAEEVLAKLLERIAT